VLATVFGALPPQWLVMPRSAFEAYDGVLKGALAKSHTDPCPTHTPCNLPVT
jgi:hypothetical protein